MHVSDAGHALSVEFDVQHLVFFAHVDAVFGRVVEQDVIELGADDLERGRALAGIVGEVPAPGLRVLAPDEGRAVLDDEASRLDRRHHADLLEHGNAGRQQRLADVFSRELRTFQQDNLVALIGQ